MIQRIQSLLLLLAAVGMALLLKFPIASYVAEPGIQNYTVNAELNLFPRPCADIMAQQASGKVVLTMPQSYADITTWPAVALVAIIFVLSLTTIFLYKNRVLQMRLTAFAFLLNVIYIGLLFLWLTESFGKTVQAIAQTYQCAPLHTTYQLGTWIPMITMALLIFAQRAIRSDEKKVRAADRLR